MRNFVLSSMNNNIYTSVVPEFPFPYFRGIPLIKKFPFPRKKKWRKSPEFRLFRSVFFAEFRGKIRNKYGTRNTEIKGYGIPRNSLFFNELLVFYVYLLNVSKLAHPWYRSILKFREILWTSVFHFLAEFRILFRIPFLRGKN